MRFWTSKGVGFMIADGISNGPSMARVIAMREEDGGKGCADFVTAGCGCAGSVDVYIAHCNTIEC